MADVPCVHVSQTLEHLNHDLCSDLLSYYTAVNGPELLAN